MTASFDHLTPVTLQRAAEFVQHGGRPDDLTMRVVRRAARIAGNDPDDVAALLLVAADR